MQTLQDIHLENDVSDEVLLSAIAQGSIEAVEALYARYHRLLYTLAYRMVGDHQIAEDLLQEAFLAVWRRSDTYSPHSGAARNWLISILHHRTIDHLRKVRRRSKLQETQLDQVDLDETVAVADVWDAAWHEIQSSELQTALLQIPPEQRLVIRLAYFEGWTHSEIAAGTQMPLGTVKARMRLGLHHLRHALEVMGMDEI